MNRPRASLLLLGSAFPLVAEASFSIDFTFEGGLTASQEVIFNEAKATWESYIVGYQAGITQTSIAITASGQTMDGEGGLLGSAGPRSAISRGGYWITRTGNMTFDSADLAALEANGMLDEVITHEIGHVLGLGTLWNEDWNQLYVNGSGQYTGAFALDAYRDEFDPSATYVPVEMSGGAGTADGHWNENDGGTGLTGITDGEGRDLAHELMTGWVGPSGAEHYISNTTLGSLRDLGFDVLIPVPEPALGFILGVGLILIGTRRRRSA